MKSVKKRRSRNFTNYSTHYRVMISMSLLVGSKVLNVAVPFLFKGAVDTLGVLNMNSAPETILAVSSSMLIGCEWNYSSPRNFLITSLNVTLHSRWYRSSRSSGFQRASKCSFRPSGFTFDSQDWTKCLHAPAQPGSGIPLESPNRGPVQSN